MFSAKWQRHSTFLSVRWRTLDWPRAYGVIGVSGKRGGGPADLWQRVTPRVPAPAHRWWHPHGRKAGFSARDMATPVSYQAARGPLNGDIRDGCWPGYMCDLTHNLAGLEA